MRKAAYLLAFFFGAMVLDYFWPLPIRSCKTSHVIDTPELAKEYAFSYWRTNESRVLFGGKRYTTAEAILKGAMDDGRLEIDQYWSMLNFGYVWRVGADIYKFNPEYYGFGLVFNRCGRILVERI